MEQIRNKFPDDKDNRIQKLYYDVNIHTIFNKMKLQNVKKKFRKYQNYLNDKYLNHIQPILLEIGYMRDYLYYEWKQGEIIAFTQGDHSLAKAVREEREPIFREADKRYEELKFEDSFYDKAICNIEVKIYEINQQQRNIYKHYRKCDHCEKMDMASISGCKLKHKLCSICIDDITECPVCNEDLGLHYCAICMEHKKILLKTGCENKHQTCKQCLDKIIGKTNPFERVVCPFCRGYCSKKIVHPHPASYYLMENGEDIRDVWQDRADDMRER